MQIERVYRPDMKYQLYAIQLLLRIRLPQERNRSKNKEVVRTSVQDSPTSCRE